jgi:hypothetical protein
MVTLFSPVGSCRDCLYVVTVIPFLLLRESTSYLQVSMRSYSLERPVFSTCHVIDSLMFPRVFGRLIGVPLPS